MMKKDLIEQEVLALIAENTKFPELIYRLRLIYGLPRARVAEDTGINYNRLCRAETGNFTSQLPDDMINTLICYYSLHKIDVTLLHRKHDEFLKHQAHLIRCPSCQHRFSVHDHSTQMPQKRNGVEYSELTHQKSIALAFEQEIA